MVQVKNYRSNHVQIVKSFKILNNVVVYKPLDPKNKIWNMKWTKWMEFEMEIIIFLLNEWVSSAI